MPKGKVTWSADARAEAGFPGLEQFFHKPPQAPQVGRPAGVLGKKRGRPPKTRQDAAPEPPVVVVPVAEPVVARQVYWKSRIAKQRQWFEKL